MSESSELRRRLKQLPRTARSEIGQAVGAGREVADPKLAEIAVEFARVRSRTHTRSLFIAATLAIVFVPGIFWLLERNERERTPVAVVALSLLFGLAVRTLIQLRAVRRFRRAELVNHALATKYEIEMVAHQASMTSSPIVDTEIPGVRLVWVSLGLVVTSWLFSWVSAGTPILGLLGLLLPGVLALEVVRTAHLRLGRVTLWLMLLQAGWAIDQLSPPFDYWIGGSGVVSLVGLGVTLLARRQAREVRHLQREEHIRRGGDPPFFESQWQDFRGRSALAQVALAALIVPLAGLLLAGIVWALIDPTPDD